MIQLVKKGMNRQEAHELLRKLAIASELDHRHFKETLVKDPTIRKFLNPQEIDLALDPEKYLGTAVHQVESMIRKTMDERCG